MMRYSWVALTLMASLSGASALLAQQTTDRELQYGRVVGVVLDATGERGLSDVGILIADIQVLSDNQGRFLFPSVPAGSHVLRVESLGYLSRSDTVHVPRNATVHLRFVLTVDPVDVEPIEVVVRSRVLELRGFYERQGSGYSGHYFERIDLVERNARDLTDLLGPLSGVRLINSGLEGNRVVFERATSITGGGLCEPALFLDGVKSGIRLYDMIIDPSHVEGVEVYAGAAIPGRFNDPCGAVLIWTRVP